MDLNDRTQLIAHLMRGGAYGHFWTKPTEETFWWPCPQGGDNGFGPEYLEAYASLPDEDCYFGVHPGRIKKDAKHRTKEEDIAAVNCLYADVDGKDFTGNGSYSAEGKQSAWEHIKQLAEAPSAIVDSGGGYQCYWLFPTPYRLTDTSLELFKTLQMQWNSYVSGDKAVHDLARLLRIPGTINHKPEYDHPVVELIELNLGLTYTPNQLKGAIASLTAANSITAEAQQSQQEFPEPKQPNNLEDQELVSRISGSDKDGKFRRLWRGGNCGYHSTSEADLALCCVLAFWTGGDGSRIDRLFRLSKRMRDKWERADYQVGTILKALAQVNSYYRPHDGMLTAGATDEGNSCVFLRRYPQKYLNVDGVGWCEFTGTYWKSRGAAAHLNDDIVEVLTERRRAAWAKMGVSGKEGNPLVKAIHAASKPNFSPIRGCRERLADSLYADIQSFNLPMDKVNCQNGVLNLETGKLALHDPSQRYTYCLPVGYFPDADQTPWTTWLLEAVNGRVEIVEYLQEAVGYSITGRTREEVMFYIFGPARSGKGIFIETVLEMLGKGDLGEEVDMGRFMKKTFESGTDDFFLASLQGIRFIAASETSGKGWFDPSKLKRWTGGNPLKVAHKHRDYFNYRPQFKFWFTSNNSPRVDPDDDAAWERVRVIQFPNSHVKDIDKKLKGRMKSQKILEGVLAWAIEGAMKWYSRDEKGMVAPKVIKEETQNARDDVNDVLRWAAAQLIITGGDSDRVPYTKAFNEYLLWCDEEKLNARPRKHWKESLLVNKVVTDIKIAAPTPGAKTMQCLIGVRSVGFYLNIEEGSS